MLHTGDDQDQRDQRTQNESACKPARHALGSDMPTKQKDAYGDEQERPGWRQ